MSLWPERSVRKQQGKAGMQDAYLLFYLQTAFFNLFLTIRLYSGTKIRKTTAAVQAAPGGKTMAKKIFKRYELKYLMSGQQAEKLRRIMQQHMRPDEYGRRCQPDVPSVCRIQKQQGSGGVRRPDCLLPAGTGFHTRGNGICDPEKGADPESDRKPDYCPD